MKITFDHQVFSLHRYGGVPRYFYEIATSIAKIGGHRVEIFSPLYVNEYFKSGDSVFPFGLHIPAIPNSKRTVRAINNIASLSLRLRRDIDIFHETYYTPYDFCPRSAKRIVTVYDMIHEKLPSYFRARDDTTQLKQKAVNRADHVICISENTRRDLIEFSGIPEEKTSVVYLGYSLARETASDVISDDRPFILYVGARDGYKNFERLVRAYATSEFLKGNFDLACFGGGAFSADELALFEKWKIATGAVKQISGNDDLLAGLYAKAAVFVYPSLYEGFGIPPLEAMAFNCPVACSNTSSLPEVTADAAELFDPSDEDAIRDAIERVLSSTEYAAGLVAKGRERIKHFGWDKCARETLDVYQKVLRG